MQKEEKITFIGNVSLWDTEGNEHKVRAESCEFRVMEPGGWSPWQKPQLLLSTPTSGVTQLSPQEYREELTGLLLYVKEALPPRSPDSE